jgi:glycosyltransferase involved in cell wall biosynthesis
MQPLSVVIITLNEERNIARCIKSAQVLADEILVVDSLSSDRTQSIAQELGAKVIEQPFLGHIEQKNFAKDQAKNDWVLSLDADEALSETLQASIRSALENPAYDGFRMNRLTNFCGQWIHHSGWYPDTKLRLFKKDAGSWQGTNPHDRFDLHDQAASGFLKGDLLHYSFYSVEEHLAQIDKFSTIAAKAKFDKGERLTPFLHGVKALAKFFKAYLLKRGFLDGYYGWVIARNSAKATYLKYHKLHQLHQEAS